MNKQLKTITATLLLTTLLTGCAPKDSEVTTTPSASPTLETESLKPTIDLTDKDVEVALTDKGKLDEDALIKAMIVSVKDVESEEIKKVTLKDGETQENGTYVVDTSKVDVTKAGDYKVTITVKSSNGNTVKKTCTVTVTEDVAKEAKATDEEKESASTEKKTDSSSKKSSKEDTTSSKKSSSSNNTSSSKTTTSTSSNNSSTATNKTSNTASTNNGNTTSNNNSNNASTTQTVTQPTHTHNWVYHEAQYTTVHHDATGHNESKTVVDQAEWVEEGRAYGYCKGNGYITYDPNNDMELGGPACGAYEIRWEPDTVHPAVTHEETVWVQDSAAWDESVVSQAAYYSCNCGATKAA